MGFIKRAFGFISNPSQSRTTGIVAMLILILAVFMTVAISQQKQTIKQHAASYNCGGLAWTGNPDLDCFSKSDECMWGRCRGTTGGQDGCVSEPKEYATSCWNGDGVCDGKGACHSIYSAPTLAPIPACNINNCNDPEDCSWPKCNAQGACDYSDKKADGNSCYKNHDYMSPGGTCQKGICLIGYTPSCPSDNNDCTLEEWLGSCAHTPKWDGTACVDNAGNSGYCRTSGSTSTCDKNYNPADKGRATKIGSKCTTASGLSLYDYCNGGSNYIIYAANGSSCDAIPYTCESSGQCGGAQSPTDSTGGTPQCINSPATYTCTNTNGQVCMSSCSSGYTPGSGTCASGVCCKASTNPPATTYTCTGSCMASCSSGYTQVSGTCASGVCCKASTNPPPVTSTCSVSGNTCTDSSGSKSGSCSGNNVNSYSCVNGTCQSSATTCSTEQPCAISSSGIPACGGSTSTTNITLVSALNARDTSLTSDTLSVNLILYNLTTNNQVAGAPATVTFNKTSIPGRLYSANVILANLTQNKYFIVFRKDNMIAQSVFTISSSNGTFTVPTTTLVFGDLDNDNKVDIIDYGIFKSCWKQPTTTSCSSSDFDNSGGIIDQVDYNTFMRGYATWNEEAKTNSVF